MTPFYPHMPIGKVWIYRLLFPILFVGLLVRLRISPPSIKLEASNLARRFIGFQGSESPIFGERCSPEAPPEAQNRTNHPRRLRAYAHWTAMARATRVCAQATTCVDIRPSPKTDTCKSFVHCCL